MASPPTRSSKLFHQETQVELLCDGLLQRVLRAEPVVTERLCSIAEKAGGRMAGLENRVKSLDSLARKIQAEMEDRLISVRNSFKPGESDARPKVDPASVIQEIGDTLRFTMLLPFETYTEEVEKCLRILEEHQISLRDCRNYWKKGDCYQGINANFSIQLPGESTPVVFELQFHTEQSFELKTQSHVFYEGFRSETDPDKKLRFFAEGSEMADTVAVPADVLRIPRLAQFSPPSKLELWGAKLFLQAETEEPEVALKMQRLFGSQLRGLESARKAQTTITREVTVLSEKNHIDAREAVKLMTVISYTVVFEAGVYTDKVKESLQRLEEEEGFEIKSVTNHWSHKDAFKGVFVVVSPGPQSLPVEIQFHSPESHDTREAKVDGILKSLLTVDDPQKVQELYDQAEEAWRSVTVPPGADMVEWSLEN